MNTKSQKRNKPSRRMDRSKHKRQKKKKNENPKNTQNKNAITGNKDTSVLFPVHLFIIGSMAWSSLCVSGFIN